MVIAPARGIAELAGGAHVALLQKHLLHLRRAYGHGNRKLFYDELVTAYLLAFFNPTLRSLRAIEDMSQSPQGQEHLRLRKLCRSTMSDANALMDAKLLEPLIGRLKKQVRDLRKRDGQLARLLEQVQLVDGSFFACAADVVWALHQRRQGIKPRKDEAQKDECNGDEAGKSASQKQPPPREATHFSKFRLDLRLEGSTRLPALPLRVSGQGQSEPQRACEGIQPQVIYVADRGFECLKYVQELLNGGADFVLRVKQGSPNFQSREDQVLDEQDRQAGVISDRIGRLSGSPHTHAAGVVPRQELREVVVFDPKNPDKPIRLITSLLDLPAHLIAQLYQWRWQIELFFRWLKVHASFAHLISHSRNGLTMGFYVAVIAVLLIYLRTGRPMSKYAYNLLSLVAAGWGTVADILPILENRERECELARQRLARKRAEKTGK